MKGLAVFLLLLVVVFSLGASAQLNTAATRGLDIHAFMGDIMNVSVAPVANSGLEGIPFDLMGPDVWYRGETMDTLSETGIGLGRLIATWSLRMNTGTRTLTISAGPLYRRTDETGTPVVDLEGIDYRLAFALSYHRLLDNTTASTFISVFSGTDRVIHNGSVDSQGVLDNWVQGDDGPINMPLISSNQPVRVLLVKNDGTPYTLEEREAWAPGNYSADVSIIISGV